MIDTNFRKYTQKGFDATAKTLRLTRLHPNHITILGFLAGVASALSLAFGRPLLALILLWLSGGLDVLDGTVARLTQRSSKTGAYLDMIFDRLTEGFIILGCYVFLPRFALFYFVFYIGAMFNFTTFMLAGALFANAGEKSMHYDGGLIERTETFLMFSLMMLFPRLIPIWLGVFNGLMIFTGIRRVVRIIRYEREKEKL